MCFSPYNTIANNVLVPKRVVGSELHFYSIQIVIKILAGDSFGLLLPFLVRFESHQVVRMGCPVVIKTCDRSKQFMTLLRFPFQVEAAEVIIFP